MIERQNNNDILKGTITHLFSLSSAITVSIVSNFTDNSLIAAFASASLRAIFSLSSSILKQAIKKNKVKRNDLAFVKNSLLFKIHTRLLLYFLKIEIKRGRELGGIKRTTVTRSCRAASPSSPRGSRCSSSPCAYPSPSAPLPDPSASTGPPMT